MASARDRLKAANAKNAAGRGNTSTNDTVTADFAGRAVENEPEVKVVPESKEEKIEKVEKLDEPKIPQLDAIVEEKTDPVKETNVEKCETNEVIVVENTSLVEINVPAESLHKEYTGKLVTVSLCLSEELSEYIELKANSLGIPLKTLFKNIMINELENGSPNDDPALLKEYQKRQHTSIKKTMSMEEDLREDIRAASPKYRIKSTAFMSYVIDKARLADKDF